MNSNDELVDYLVAAGRITSEKVEEAFRTVDRADFVPEDYRNSAYQDRPLPIGEEATISAPHMVAINTELLDVEENNRVVEVGSGSGYQVAILSEIAEEVTGVEIEKDLVEKSRKALEGRENVEIVEGSGFEPVEGKFDRILYSCGIESIEPAKEYINDRGVIVAPVKEENHQVVTKWDSGEVTKHGAVRFVEFKEED